MNDKELSIRDIRSIGGGRYIRKFEKSAVVWVLLLMVVALLISGFVVGVSAQENPQYTLPSGEVVELDGNKLIIEDTIISERNNPTPIWSPGFALMLASLGIFLALVVYMSIQEERARNRIMEEWLAAGYQPKATDV